MVCRGEEREFVAWQHKEGKPPDYDRGELVRFDPEVQTKSQEIRPKEGQMEIYFDKTV